MSSLNPVPGFSVSPSVGPPRCVRVCSDGGFPSILMVIGALEWSFCSRARHQASGAGLQIDNELS